LKEETAMIENYTTRQLGSMASMSRAIVRCKVCGRLGALETRRDQSRCCVHVERLRIHPDGMLVEPRDSCELGREESAQLFSEA
jgi:hypothetical protein